MLPFNMDPVTPEYRSLQCMDSYGNLTNNWTFVLYNNAWILMVILLTTGHLFCTTMQFCTTIGHLFFLPEYNVAISNGNIKYEVHTFCLSLMHYICVQSCLLVEHIMFIEC